MRFIAFLRAINVGGHVVKMDALRSLFESMGLSKTETFIASGNVVFETSSRNAQSLERALERRLRASLGYEVATFLRTDSEVAAIARYRPFTDAARASAVAFCVGLVGEALGRDSIKKVMAFQTGIDDFHVHGREVYWLCKKGQSESTFSNNRFEKALGMPATFRGVKTMLRLAEKYAPRA